LVGAALVSAGWGALNWTGLLPVLIALVMSPTLGLGVSTLLVKLLSKPLSAENPSQRVLYWSKAAQFIGAACLSLGHGGNDAQKTMGIIAVLLFSGGLLGDHFYVPFWVMMSCNLVMGLGTLCGGWRIIHTMGEKITPLTPFSGSCAAAGAAATLLAANEFGLPISTTHTVTGSIIGSGLSKGWTNIQWSTVYQILWSWLLTIPLSAFIAGGIMYISYLFKII
jgi:PiT family inorganic phosphate transporter